ncbi:tRNA 2-selenouridine synthase [Trichococcus ilyis]|uniref:tRNA 2-selenouridine synthase n=1 Tax=Trichococcus ilyis TaxID=640938 RepID=A0A143Z846_9LACT|nr:trna 2-selenouridine synthase [Trichococcus ilyis]SEJ80498.1 tRNA 2-selenouridine synthase [Trichococcus ilyis]
MYVDVRSPSEYAKATIPGAVNVPVLDDEDRKVVGTLYVAGRVDEAKSHGIQAISPRLPEMFRLFQEYVRAYDQVVIFCSRGGFRSNSIFSLLKSLGMNVYRMEGGYKNYRSTINKLIPALFERIQFVTLYGNTGTGKTAILEELKKRGANVLDLEACANNRGSVFGNVGLAKNQPHNQKMFESLLVESAATWKAPLIVFTEGESKRIGRAVLPPSLVEAMYAGVNLNIEASLDYRIGQIKKDYLHSDEAELIAALERLKPYLNEARVEGYKEQVRQHAFDAVIADLLVKYYDPRYNFNKKEFAATFRNEDAARTAEAILEWMKRRND